MKFRFYITDLCNGIISGSNNEDVARNFSCCEDYFIVDTETVKWISSGGDVEIEDIEK